MNARILFLLLMILPVPGMTQPPKVSVTLTDGIQDPELKRKIQYNSSYLLTRINEAYLKGINLPDLKEEIIVAEAIAEINDLWLDDHFYCSQNAIREILLKKQETFQIRNVPFVFSESDKFEVVLEFLPDGRISDFRIGLAQNQYKSVLDATGVIDQTRREIILDFIENFRTAYVKKDIEYIKTLYSDKALIITGKVIKQKANSTDGYSSSLSKSQIEYQVSTKKEYIERLSGVFKRISYLRLDFNDIEVRLHTKYPNFYGVTLEQIWNSSNYRDRGILFLLIQFDEGRTEDPIIWVRTWQNADETAPEDVFGLHNFKIAPGNSGNSVN